MLVFQVLLLLGYGYAYAVSFQLKPTSQALLHICVLGVAVGLLGWRFFTWHSPFLPASTWKPEPGGNPVVQIVTVLLASVALPYFTLSTTASLLQTWFGRNYNRQPYRWYALSNTGSLLGLLTYPFFFEPALSLRHQAVVWFIGFALFAVSCALVAAAFAKARHGTSGVWSAVATLPNNDRPSWRRGLIWTLLAACGSSMLLATTNQICQDVAVIPLLWVLPLSLYLLSFILCFDSERWYSRSFWSAGLGVGTLLIVFALYHPTLSLKLQIPFYCFGLFAACMVCHGELIRLKPAASHLATFYLMVAAGGALGGVFVSLLAPVLFKGFWEFQVSVWTSCILLLVILLQDTSSWVYQPRPWLLAFSALLVFVGLGTSQQNQSYTSLAVVSIITLAFVAFILTGDQHSLEANGGNTRARFSVGFSALALATILAYPAVLTMHDALATSRNFYGTLRVVDSDINNPKLHSRRLFHGKIIHGIQFLSATERTTPSCYYAPQSGIGQAIAQQSAKGQPLRIGVVGLGVGTIAGYGRPGDYVRFYEINPQVIEMSGLSTEFFSYVNESRATIDVVPGDARISMEREAAAGDVQQFDVLAVDAFSGDAVPLHLLTAEAFNLYLRHLRGPESVLAFHVTNGNLDLSPAIARAAQEVGKSALLVRTTEPAECKNTWIIVGAPPGLPAGAHSRELHADPKFHLWTDDYSNILSVLRR